MNEFTENTPGQDRAIRQFLRSHLGTPQSGEAIRRMLADAGDYYDAGRACIFQLNAQGTQLSCAFEWCRTGIRPDAAFFQSLPAGDLMPWLQTLEQQGELFISSLRHSPVAGCAAGSLLLARGTQSLLAAPLLAGGAVAGFLGVENPRRSTGDLLFLSVVASTCCNGLAALCKADSTPEKTGIAPVDQARIIQSLGEIYTSLYEIDLASGCFTELSSVNVIHAHIGASGNAQERLNYFCNHLVAPDCRKELLAFVDLSTLNRRLGSSRIISMQYRSTLFPSAQSPEATIWRECSFIECDRDCNGQLAHVIFSTQSIHAAKVRELEAQQKLQQTNRELTALLAAEKQHTAIIGAMSNVYFALYCINLEENTFQELISLDRLHHMLGEKGNARKALKHMTDELVGAAHRPLMRNFTDFDTIDVRLGSRPLITQEYEAKTGGWARCALIPVEKDENGQNRTVLCALRWITAEKEELESQNSLIQALAIPYDNIYAINMDTRQNVCYRMGQTIHDLYGKEFATGNYEQNLATYIENDVLQEDRPLFDRLRTVQGVNALLTNKKTHSFKYRVLRGGQVQYFQCQLVKPTRERNEFVIAFQNINEEQRQELAQQQKIEEALAAVEKSNEMLQDEMEIASALTKDYPDVSLVDLEQNSATTIKLHGNMIPEGNRFSRRAYTETWESYLSKYVLEEDRESLRSAVSIDAVVRALENSNEYSCSYRILFDQTGMHYYQAVFIRVYSRHATKSRIILGFRNVDTIVEEERKHTRIQEEQLRIIDALSQEYHSLFKIDADTGELSLYRTDGLGMDAALINKLLKAGSYEDILAKYIDAYIIPEDRERMRFSTRLALLLERVPEVGLYKLGYRRNLNGRISYYEMNAAKITGENGKITFILGIRDVDEEMQRQLKQAREMETQSEIIEGLASEYYSVLLVDPAADTVTAYRAQDEDGLAIAEHFRRHNHCWSRGLRSYCEGWISENSRSEFMEKLSLERFRRDGRDYSFTYEKLTDEGVIYLQARISFVHEKDGRLAVVIGTRNVDDLIRKERQQETALQAAFDAAEAASRAKTDFLSNMSHDIRTPMNGIIGMTAIAAAHIDDKERVQDSLQKITQASKHLLSLINEVLDMSKIESGKVDLVEEEFNLSDLIDNLLTMTSAQINAHRHELSVNISDVMHEAVVGDSLRIQKVFANLMSNAVKYTPDGGRIQLSISEKPCNQAKLGCFEFIFEDNGIGMSEEFLKQIFQPFTRASDDRVNKIQGTGLGMSISRNIVRMMGGDIKVESQLGVGSRFTVTIYLKLQDAAEVRVDQLVNLDVLVADDDELSLESCCGMLNDFGMKAEGVSTGEQAVEKVVLHHRQQRDYFACIIDWKMPGMDGIATTRAIRRAVGSDVPIIIISAYDWSDIEQEARAAGANAFISKPLFRSRLVKTFNALVDNAEPKEQEPPLVALETMNLAGRRVLLVEDNELNAEIAAEVLKMTGLAVDRVADGTEAVDRMAGIRDGYYDMILMDIQMPRMNGYDATRAIRAMNRDYCKRIPIIAMTANAFAEDVQAAKTVGMNEHIAKPLDLNMLARTLDKWLR